MPTLKACNARQRSPAVAVFCDDNAAPDAPVKAGYRSMGHLPCRLARRDQIHPAGAEVIAFQRTDNGHIRQHGVDTRRYDFFRILMQQLIHDRFSLPFICLPGFCYHYTAVPAHRQQKAHFHRRKYRSKNHFLGLF